VARGSRLVAGLALSCMLAGAAALATSVLAQTVPPVRATRLPQNPLLTVDSSPTLGKNVNGPTVIRVPDWVQRPLGRYYMYFANHVDNYIRLAYANAIGGPWTVYEPGVQHVRDTAFYRPQPDLLSSDGFSTHLASPEIFIDHMRRRIVMWTHGWYTNGERFPSELPAARAWAAKNGYGQFTQGSESPDGLKFETRPPLTKDSYLRIFQSGGWFYGMTRLGQLFRAKSPLEAFEQGANPFRDGSYAGRVRHVSFLLRGQQLLVFFTAIRDAPERMLLSTIDVSGDWAAWSATTPVEIMRPEAAYECASLPIEPSERGDVSVPARQIRDPYIFQDEGRTFLFYSTCGEQGIAAAELMLP
jgi:hypothetical protein